MQRVTVEQCCVIADQLEELLTVDTIGLMGLSQTWKYLIDSARTKKRSACHTDRYLYPRLHQHPTWESYIDCKRCPRGALALITPIAETTDGVALRKSIKKARKKGERPVR